MPWARLLSATLMFAPALVQVASQALLLVVSMQYSKLVAPALALQLSVGLFVRPVAPLAGLLWPNAAGGFTWVVKFENEVAPAPAYVVPTALFARTCQ